MSTPEGTDPQHTAGGRDHPDRDTPKSPGPPPGSVPDDADADTVEDDRPDGEPNNPGPPPGSTTGHR